MRPSLLLALVAIGLLAMMVTFQAPQVQAQSVSTLVSNTGQAAKTPAILVNNANTTKRAQAFTTGANDDGYTLSSIGIAFGPIVESNPEDKLTVTLNDVSSGDPGDVLCTLVHPASYTSSGVNRYAAPDACPELTANTTYFVVIERSDTTGNDAEDSGGADGWSIAYSRESFSVLAPNTGSKDTVYVDDPVILGWRLSIPRPIPYGDFCPDWRQDTPSFVLTDRSAAEQISKNEWRRKYGDSG